MNVKSVAGQVEERRAHFALSSRSVRPLAGHWSVSDFVALTKPRVMMLAVFTALVGLSSAPSRLDPLTTFAAVLAIAAGAGAAGVLNMCKTIADQFCERPAVPASSHSADRLAERWRLSDFFELTKPRVMLLAVFTAVVGLISAPGQLDPLQALVAVLSIAAGAGAAGALNMWYDADIDAVMTRTAMRPIPRGRISRVEALVFGARPWRYRSRGSRSRDEPHGSRAVGLHDPLLCRRVHGMAEAGHATEHRHRRRRRRAAARDRMGRGNGRNRARASYVCF